MIIQDTPLNDAYIIEPKVFEDGRGYFLETYNDEKVKGTVLESFQWVQENESKSVKGVLRGMHFQKGSYAQSKLVRVISGEVFDAVVDLRKGSETFGQWHGLILSGENKRQFLVPRGFAHGFLVLSEEAVFQYKCDSFYTPEQESGIMFNDPDIGISWPELEQPYLLSAKDKALDSFSNAYKF